MNSLIIPWFYSMFMDLGHAIQGIMSNLDQVIVFFIIKVLLAFSLKIKNKSSFSLIQMILHV